MIEEAAKGSWRDWLQLSVVILGVVGGLIAAIKALFDLRENLRWKRANAAREFLTEIHRHPRASTAVMMMDWCDSGHEYEIKPNQTEEISYDRVLESLKKEQKDCGGKDKEVERFIRDCFDWFFYFVGRIERYIEINLIKFEDVAPVFSPYAKIINAKENKHTYSEFMKSHEYGLAAKFWKRYEKKPSFLKRIFSAPDSDDIKPQSNAPAETSSCRERATDQ
jgi:hypothetical protein